MTLDLMIHNLPPQVTRPSGLGAMRLGVANAPGSLAEIETGIYNCMLQSDVEVGDTAATAAGELQRDGGYGRSCNLPDNVLI